MAVGMTPHGVSVHVTYRPLNNPYLDKRVRDEREAYGIQFMVPKSRAKGAKELLNALEDGQNIFFMNDQKFNKGVEVPFFGVGVMTAPGPTRLAMKTGAPIVPVSIVRTKGTHFHVTVHDPIAVEKTGNDKDDVYRVLKKINEFYEEQIRAHPANWFWVHRRWPKPLYKKPPASD